MEKLVPTFTATSNEHTEDINIEIKIDALKVLTSGIAFSSSGTPIEISVDDVTVSFIFIDDNEDNKTRLNTKVINDKEVNIKLINFNNSLAQGKVIPTPLMYTDYFNIYFSYMVNTLNKEKGHRQLSYTIYYGDRK